MCIRDRVAGYRCTAPPHPVLSAASDHCCRIVGFDQNMCFHGRCREVFEGCRYRLLVAHARRTHGSVVVVKGLPKHGMRGVSPRLVVDAAKHPQSTAPIRFDATCAGVCVSAAWRFSVGVDGWTLDASRSQAKPSVLTTTPTVLGCHRTGITQALTQAHACPTSADLVLSLIHI